MCKCVPTKVGVKSPTDCRAVIPAQVQCQAEQQRALLKGYGGAEGEVGSGGWHSAPQSTEQPAGCGNKAS